MGFSITSISTGATLRAPRVIVLGVEKVGKSEFAAGAESPIFIPIKGEEGIDYIPTAKFPTVNTYAGDGGLLDALGVLIEEDHDYQTCVLDSSTTLEPLIWDAVCRENNEKTIEEVGGGYGKGYLAALNKWREVTAALDEMRNSRGMASIIIGHVKVKTFNDPESDPYDVFQWDLNEKAAALLMRWADVVLFASFKQAITETKGSFGGKHRRGVGRGQRVLRTQKRPTHPGGGRGPYGRLPYELPLSWDHFAAAVATAAETLPVRDEINEETEVTPDTEQ